MDDFGNILKVYKCIFYRDLPDKKNSNCSVFVFRVKKEENGYTDSIGLDDSPGLNSHWL